MDWWGAVIKFLVVALGFVLLAVAVGAAVGLVASLTAPGTALVNEVTGRFYSDEPGAWEYPASVPSLAAKLLDAAGPGTAALVWGSAVLLSVWLMAQLVLAVYLRVVGGGGA